MEAKRTMLAAGFDYEMNPLAGPGPPHVCQPEWHDMPPQAVLNYGCTPGSLAGPEGRKGWPLYTSPSPRH